MLNGLNYLKCCSPRKVYVLLKDDANNNNVITAQSGHFKSRVSGKV